MTQNADEDEARFVLQKAFGITPLRVTRYRTGYCHRVFEIEQQDKSPVVLRLTSTENKAYHDGCLYWLPRLRELGLPVPDILGHGAEGDTRYALLSHIPGADLGQTYANMSEDEKKTLACDLACFQKQIEELKSPGGFGWTFVNEAGKSKTWRSHLVGEVERARSSVEANGVFDPRLSDLVLAAMRPLEAYLDAVPSKLFLDDITTKNVLVHNGRLSGIVDVDGMTLGDRLFTLGLTKVALLNIDADTRYIDYWLDALAADAVQRRSVDWYALAFCFSLMGEVGTRFDNGVQVAVSAAATERLKRIFDSLLPSVEYIPAKTIVGKTKSNEWFGADYNMNIYRGCNHGCIYCDSRSDCYQIEDFDRVRAKADALEIIHADLKRKRRKGVIATGAMSDPYNPLERDLELTRDALALVEHFRFGLAVATKSDLVRRDADMFQAIQVHAPIIIKITVTTHDDVLAGKIEPEAPSPSHRFKALRALADKGVFSGILLMPVLPFITDSPDNLRGIVKAAAESGARFVYPWLGMTLRDGQREHYYRELVRLFPGIVEQYKKRYGNRYDCAIPDARECWRLLKAECDKHGLLCEMPDIIAAYQKGYGEKQLRLF